MMQPPPTNDPYGLGIGPFRKPYANAPQQAMGDAQEEANEDPVIQASEGDDGEDIEAKFTGLPPEMQDALLRALGNDPLASSAFLAIVGPSAANFVQEAMKAGNPALAGPAGAPPMQGGAPPMPPPMMVPGQ